MHLQKFLFQTAAPALLTAVRFGKQQLLTKSPDHVLPMQLLDLFGSFLVVVRHARATQTTIAPRSFGRLCHVALNSAIRCQAGPPCSGFRALRSCVSGRVAQKKVTALTCSYLK